MMTLFIWFNQLIPFEWCSLLLIFLQLEWREVIDYYYCESEFQWSVPIAITIHCSLFTVTILQIFVSKIEVNEFQLIKTELTLDSDPKYKFEFHSAIYWLYIVQGHSYDVQESWPLKVDFEFLANVALNRFFCKYLINIVQIAVRIDFYLKGHTHTKDS